MRDNDGLWRPDYLARARDVLRLVLRAAVWARDLVFYKNADIDDAVREVGLRWGVESFPAHHTGAEARRVLRWADALAADSSVIAVLHTWIADTAVGPGVESASDLASPSWPIARPEEWPPIGSGEQRQLVHSAMQSLGAHPLLRHGEAEMLEVLRRRVAELHMRYLGEDPRTNTRFFHLRHQVIRAWFNRDLLDLHGAPAATGEGDELTGPAAAVARSQAAIAAMLFHDTVINWNQDAISAIVEGRYAWRIALGEFEPLEQLVRRRRHRSSTGPPSLLRPARGMFEEPAFVLNTSPTARELLRRAEEFRASRDRPHLARYLALRQDVKWERSSYEDRRVVLLADQQVHLAAVGVASRRDVQQLDRFLGQSATLRPPYAEFIPRDRSLSNSKRGAIESALDGGRKGMQSLRENAPASPLVSAKRAETETEHQLALAIAGTLAKVLEKLLADYSAPAARHEGRHRLVEWVSAADYWSNLALELLQRMEDEGWLQTERLQEGYLADRRWRSQTRIIRHRVLCAVFSLSNMEALQGGGTDLRDRIGIDREALSSAYLEMVQVQEVAAAQPLLITQLALWHGFLMSNEIPFEPDLMSVGLRRYDYLTSSELRPRASESTIGFDSERRMLAAARLIDADWDSGVLERIPAQSTAWIALDLSSNGAYSEWRHATAGLRRAARGEE
ncbi:hypothetical protein [Microbacterium sp. PMB16]|uniref:hypothetical protein n=1 Tax=Microbacterium sp. PMB16 TaxID=3120157 RepID=UPI003F4B5004